MYSMHELFCIWLSIHFFIFFLLHNNLCYIELYHQPPKTHFAMSLTYCHHQTTNRIPHHHRLTPLHHFPHSLISLSVTNLSPSTKTATATCLLSHRLQPLRALIVTNHTTIVWSPLPKSPNSPKSSQCTESSSNPNLG